jgi:NAD(P)H-dependent flavin oxidoreductase YrpB (nitropropane dioxygenase family)
VRCSTAKLGIDSPIIQGLLGGLSSQRLIAAVPNFGGLGSFGARGLGPEAVKDVIVLDAGHFALDTKADQIAALVGQFTKAQK